ncbi:MAG: hypothetical protein AAGU21_00265 [Solidesulfovibrio sp.]|uniref:hypothetical protein n=1 Tax=Solidesulfovibrio sp. TaxID=2910990 RepID=UPI003158D7A6
MSALKSVSAATKIALLSSTTLGMVGGGGCALAGQYMASGLGTKIAFILGFGGASLVSAPIVGGAVIGGVTAAALTYAYGCGKRLIVKTETFIQTESFKDGPE